MGTETQRGSGAPSSPSLKLVAVSGSASRFASDSPVVEQCRLEGGDPAPDVAGQRRRPGGRAAEGAGCLRSWEASGDEFAGLSACGESSTSTSSRATRR